MVFDFFEHFGAVGQKPELRMAGFNCLAGIPCAFSCNVDGS